MRKYVSKSCLFWHTNLSEGRRDRSVLLKDQKGFVACLVSLSVSKYFSYRFTTEFHDRSEFYVYDFSTLSSFLHQNIRYSTVFPNSVQLLSSAETDWVETCIGIFTFCHVNVVFIWQNDHDNEVMSPLVSKWRSDHALKLDYHAVMLPSGGRFR